eukprot:Selendium_serpulae@DN4358_c0_g1_i12.p1
MSIAESVREFDVIVYGATGYIGRLVTEYLFKAYGPSGENVFYAVAGRDPAKLAQLQQQLSLINKSGAESLPIIIASSDSTETELRRMCRRGFCVVSTVGSFTEMGEPLIRACLESGTHYCDLSAELVWIRQMIEKYSAVAAYNQVKIIHSCGFASVFSDLGTLLLQSTAWAQFGRCLPDVRCRVTAHKGSPSGGHLKSLLYNNPNSADDKKQMKDPYVLCSSADKGPIDPSNPKDSFERLARRRTMATLSSSQSSQSDVHKKSRQAALALSGHANKRKDTAPGGVVKTRQFRSDAVMYDDHLKKYVIPFYYSNINTAIVMRTNFLFGGIYGSRFRYHEALVSHDSQCQSKSLACRNKVSRMQRDCSHLG